MALRWPDRAAADRAVGGVLERVAWRVGGEVVRLIGSGGLHHVLVAPAGVFVVGPEGTAASVRRQTDHVRTLVEDDVPVEAVVVGPGRTELHPARLADHVVHCRPPVIAADRIGRVAARIRLGGVVRILPSE